MRPAMDTPGMHVNSLGARRAMALVEQQADADGGPDGYISTATAPANSAAGQQRAGEQTPPGWETPVAGGGIGKVGGGRAEDANTLLRRAKALGVPPLPPQLGAVRSVSGNDCR